MGRESKYLLSGLVRCGVCGGSILRAAVRRALAVAKQRKAVDPDAAKKRVAKLEAERGRLVAAIRMGGALDSLVESLGACENALRDARAEAEAEGPAGEPCCTPYRTDP